jgi:RNA polymerase sigma-70 factor (ECF subfamily)
MNMDRMAQTAGDDYWIEQYRLGNPEGLGVLYQRYFQKVYHKCLSLSKDPDEAFDLAQDALLKAFEHLPSFRGQASFSTWLYAITYNHCQEFFRKAKRLFVLRLEDSGESTWKDAAAPSPEDALQPPPTESTLLALFNHIPETDRRMLLLKYHDGQSIEHLQTVFMLSASAVKMRLKRARQKLNTLYARAVA